MPTSAPIIPGTDGAGDEVAQRQEDAEPHHAGHAEDAAVERDHGECDDGDWRGRR